MIQKKLDEKELLAVLELTKSAEQNAREMCESVSAYTEKWRRRAEAQHSATSQTSA